MIQNKSKKKWRKRIIFAVLAIIIIAVLLFIGLKPKPVSSDMIAVKKGSISTYYSFSGSIEAKNREMLFADQALQIKEWNVKEGDLVKVDDVLYTTKLGVSKKATIAGEVLKIYADVNQQVMPGGKILEIVDYSNYLLKVKVDEYDFSAIKKGGKASVKINSISEDVEGTVDDVSKEGSYLNGVTYFQATIVIPPDDRIRVGMSAEARVLNQEASDVLILPIEAILFDTTNKPYVNVLNEKVLVRTDLELGITDGVYVEVKSGVTLDQQVTVKKANTLDNFRPGRNG